MSRPRFALPCSHPPFAVVAPPSASSPFFHCYFGPIEGHRVADRHGCLPVKWAIIDRLTAKICWKCRAASFVHRVQGRLVPGGDVGVLVVGSLVWVFELLPAREVC